MSKKLSKDERSFILQNRLDEERIKTHVGYNMMIENYKLMIADKSR